MSFRALSVLLLLGCKGDPGFITVVVEGLTGSEGLLLITEARDAEGNQAAISCVSIDADPFETTVELEAIVGPTPCEVSEPIELDGGTYDLLTATILGGETEPRACATAQVEVDGDVSVTMPALGDCE